MEEVRKRVAELEVSLTAVVEDGQKDNGREEIGGGARQRLDGVI
jgi:hypothetical protein